MANNITNIKEAIAERDAENARLAAESFNAEDMELTPEEKEKLQEMKSRTEVVITETTPAGTSSTTPMETYMAGIDESIKNIRDSSGNFVAKGLNVGDIKRTTEQMKADAQKRAVSAFRKMALDQEFERTDDDIISINNQAIAAIQAYLKVDKLDANEIIRKFRKLSLKQIAEILPQEFTEIYLKESEIIANNLPAKERLLATLGYLSVTGPELDYLNEYIDHENKLMMLSHRMVECQLTIAEVLKSQESLVELAKKANALVPSNPDSPWAKYIKGGPRRLHNEFAQKAVVTEMTQNEYEKLLDEYKDDPECTAQIQEQIDESRMKYEAYLNITELTLMRELWASLIARLKADKRTNYKSLEREAISAIDRIRRAKQNVSFPIYAEGKPGNNKPEVLYRMYMDQYPVVIGTCNETIKAVREKDPDGMIGTEDIRPIEIEGFTNQQVHEMFAILLLILYGRIMKKLMPLDQTKYQAIELDMYFTMYCKLITDVYLMDSVWSMMRDFVEYALRNWPAPTGKKRHR